MKHKTKLTDANEGMQSIKELWESVAKLSKHVVEDNEKYDGEYPVSVREMQMVTLKALIRELETHHTVK